MANTKRKSKATINALWKAKSVYAERSDLNSCGDWMAEALKVLRTKGGDFDLEGFTHCLKENGIEPPNVDRNKDRWRGRFRMCAGLMLRRRLAKVGFVVIDGKKITAPGGKKRGRKAKAAAATEYSCAVRSLLYTFAYLLASLATSEAFSFSS